MDRALFVCGGLQSFYSERRLSADSLRPALAGVGVKEAQVGRLIGTVQKLTSILPGAIRSNAGRLLRLSGAPVIGERASGAESLKLP